MDREAQEEGFSSQSVNPEITSISRGTAGKAVKIVLSDGSSFFMHTVVAEKNSIYEGMPIDDDTVRRLLFESEVYLAGDKAADYLARREHSEAELMIKLKKKGFSTGAAETALGILKQKGYVDDAHFAEVWIRSRLCRHPEGRIKLLAGLLARGVERNTAERICADMVDSETEAEALERAADRCLRNRKVGEDKLVRYLSLKGFGYGDIRRYIENRGPHE